MVGWILWHNNLITLPFYFGTIPSPFSEELKWDFYEGNYNKTCRPPLCDGTHLASLGWIPCVSEEYLQTRYWKEGSCNLTIQLSSYISNSSLIPLSRIPTLCTMNSSKRFLDEVIDEISNTFQPNVHLHYNECNNYFPFS